MTITTSTPRTGQDAIDTLRHAARRLRDAVAGATVGPWHARPVHSADAVATSAVYSHAHPAGTVASEVVASGRIRSGYGGIRNPDNAVYIAMMQPAVASTVADWLDETAHVMTWLGPPRPDTDPHGRTWLCDFADIPRSEWDHALSCARTILAATESTPAAQLDIDPQTSP